MYSECVFIEITVIETPLENFIIDCSLYVLMTCYCKMIVDSLDINVNQDRFTGYKLRDDFMNLPVCGNKLLF